MYYSLKFSDFETDPYRSFEDLQGVSFGQQILFLIPFYTKENNILVYLLEVSDPFFNSIAKINLNISFDIYFLSLDTNINNKIYTVTI